MKAKSIHGNSTEELRIALAQSISDDYTPTLAFVFISIKQDRKTVCAMLAELGIDIIGATSSGEFTDGHQSEGATVVMLLDLPKEVYSVFFETIGDGFAEMTARHLGEAAKRKYNTPAIIFCSTFLSAQGEALDGETLMRNIENVVGSQVNIFGGMAGDDLSFTGSFVFTNNDATDNGLVALIVDADKIAMQGMAISGWKPMGISRTITKSEGNLIYTIDDKPALETYMRFLGGDISTADDNFNFFDSVGVHYPFQIERENREPMMCNPIGYDRDKEALITESNVAQGTKFRFSTPPDFDIIETVVGKAKALKSETNAEANALLIFSCVGRLSALGPMAQQENEGIQEVWNAPMAGFYTYGEFGRAVNGKHEFHSTTCCWVALSEK